MDELKEINIEQRLENSCQFFSFRELFSNILFDMFVYLEKLDGQLKRKSLNYALLANQIHLRKSKCICT